MEKTKKKKKITSKSITMFLFTVPSTIVYSLFFIYPMILGIYYGFTNWNGISKDYEVIGFKNYIDVFSNSRFQKSILFTMKYTVWYVILVIGISLVLALIFNMRIKGNGFFRAVYFFPAVVSGLIVSLIFRTIFVNIMPQLGKQLGIDWLSRNILGSKDTAMFGILIITVWGAVAMATVILLAGLQSVPMELYESAELDGAGKWAKFRYITFPFLLPVFSVEVILQLKGGLCVMDVIMAITGGGPAGATESVSMLIYNHGFREVNFSYAIAEAMILALIIIAISFAQLIVTNKKKVY